ncbi:MAG: hypothetical protein LW860_07005 [Xanthomonadaceae bacterium]|nr:hypothetical protein [Xanthomonadaceae bacterium]
MDDAARAAFEAELALVRPEWVAQLRREAAGPAPFAERLREDRRAAVERIGAALALIEDAGNVTALWIAARAEGVDLPETGERLRRLLSGLQGLATHERRAGRPPRFARALALDEMATMWRRHGLGAGDASDERFVERAVAVYRADFGRSHGDTRNTDVRASIRDDLARLAELRSGESQANE